MKVMIKLSMILTFFIMLVSCATTPSAIPEKYNLDNELEPVDKIFTVREPRWQEVDDQSIILRADRRVYYLIVLRRPMGKRYSNPRIRLSNTSYVTPGIDRIYAYPSDSTTGYVIEKIYKLEGREQAEEIKERFANN